MRARSKARREEDKEVKTRRLKKIREKIQTTRKKLPPRSKDLMELFSEKKLAMASAPFGPILGFPRKNKYSKFGSSENFWKREETPSTEMSLSKSRLVQPFSSHPSSSPLLLLSFSSLLPTYLTNPIKSSPSPPPKIQ
jgi:hypothetical protein